MEYPSRFLDEPGKKPAARRNPDNADSRRTLRRLAFFLAGGY
jgi:hypothetical protein